MTSSQTIEVRVVPRNLRWEVSVDGVTRRLIDWLCTRERAVTHAIDCANERLRFEGGAVQAVVIVERADRSEEERLVIGAQQQRAS